MANKELAEESSTELVGRLVLGRYRIVHPIARGGMGVVYLGRVEGAEGFSKPVVIKSVLPVFGGGGDGERLFAREARIVANLQHPGIVAVIDFGKIDATHVMVLEYVHGYHLGQWSRFVNETWGCMPTPFAVHIALCLLEALAFAHGLNRPDGTPLGIVHRDVSPGNVLIDLQGHIKLSDFGIARMADDEFKTQEGVFRGTLAFCAPESVQGAAPDRAMDQYGVAAVLYHLLAGKNPFIGSNHRETLSRVLCYVPPLLSSLRHDVPEEIDAAIARALCKNPGDRFESAADFARALRSGCNWSEREEAERFSAQIALDFGGEEMAKRLNLEPLPLRDAAWREVQDTGERVPLRSTPPQMKSEVLQRNPGGVARATLDNDPEQMVPTKPAPRRRPALWIALAALAAGAGAAAVITLLPRPQTEHVPRLVVIEKEQASNNEGTSPSAAAVTHPPEATPSPSIAQPSASVGAPSIDRPAPAAAAAAPANRGAVLARAFQRQEGRIQNCLRDNAASLEGAPQISVRFHIDASGTVQNAVLSPPSVATTPLGACIAAVARATDFGPQPEAVSFAIPIAARVVHH